MDGPAPPHPEVLDAFDPLVREWFTGRFAAPTEAQAAGWPLIASRRDTLITAPTGSGKTLAAFLWGLDHLITASAGGALPDETSILYVTPLRALGNDIQRNLEAPLSELRALAARREAEFPELRVAVRSGDTPPSIRQQQVRRPPHILITTPESLYLLLTSRRGREALRTVQTVIVDEIHALARDRRGSHLALSLERLDHVVEGAGARRPVRVGLSATVRPVGEVARFLVGSAPGGAERPCEVVDLGHQRDLDLAVEVPPTDLEAVTPREQWDEIYDRLADLVTGHRTTLVFVNTRQLSERVAHRLEERLGSDAVASHHGSLSRERRERVESRLKAGELRALVATASLELGIDIGAIDLVCQVGSPRSIATFLQRVGRSGHALGLRPSGRIFPTTRDDLVEAAALVRAVRSGRLDRIEPLPAPLDVLAQQIVAECAAEEWDEEELFAFARRAHPFRALERSDYDEVVAMLAEGVGSGAGRAAPLIHRDRIHGMLRGRRSARLAALLNGGTIPEMGDYRVVAEPGDTVVGSVGEDFAVESAAGDIFLLGSTSWRIRRLVGDTVRVADAQGAPPTIPFWEGQAPGRTRELSEEVGRLRRDVAARLDGDPEELRGWLVRESSLPDAGAAQLADYLRATRGGLGLVPTDEDVVFERFFDESGGMQLVVHAPFGQRVNRAWGLALRKRFCVVFDFELQAAASDDAILLSLGPQHSFPLEESFRYVTSQNLEHAVEQSVLYTPLLPTRWRWNATRALAVPRRRGGKRVAPWVQRMRADDLLASVFPDVVGCQENVTGALELPDHVLIRQTMRDCLREVMDVDGARALLERVEAGAIRLHARDTTEPSPMAHEIVAGRPFTYLDDAPLEERRARAVQLRRTLPEHQRDLGALDPGAIERVRQQAWPDPRNAEEVHDALLGLVAVREEDARGWEGWLSELEEAGRAGRALSGDEGALWFAAEHLPAVSLLYAGREILLARPPPQEARIEVEHREDARARLLRGHAEVSGPLTIPELAARSGLSPVDAGRGVAQLEAGGFVLRGRFTPAAAEEEICDRALLARIHRYTLEQLRQEIAPLPVQELMRFLLRWHGVAPGAELSGRAGLRAAITRLRGFEAPAASWERELLQARVVDYEPAWLDELALSGELAWARLTPRRAAAGSGRGPASRATPVTLAPRADLGLLLEAVRRFGPEPAPPPEAGAGAEILALLAERGALFLDEIVTATRRLPQDVERGLRVLVGLGLITADGVQPLRDVAGRHRGGGSRRRGPRRRPLAPWRTSRGEEPRLFLRGRPTGRWSLLERAVPPGRESELDTEGLAEEVARVLLDRWGVVFRDLALRESFTAPWREVLRALRRLEARGLVRGGRFVTGFHGEQFALPEAVEALRRLRREPHAGERVVVAAVDPLNLTGALLPGARVPSQPGRTVTLVDGAPEEAGAAPAPPAAGAVGGR